MKFDWAIIYWEKEKNFYSTFLPIDVYYISSRGLIKEGLNITIHFVSLQKKLLNANMTCC